MLEIEIEKALAAIPGDLEARYTKLSETIKAVEQELFERKVKHEAFIVISETRQLLWTDRARGVWMLCISSSPVRPLIECPLDVRIEAAQHIPALILKLAEMGVKIR